MILAEELVVTWKILSCYEWFLEWAVTKKSQLGPCMCFLLNITVEPLCVPSYACRTLPT